ncbi:MAG: glycosyltransferase family 2 protein [Planctomycetaceae bacterium]|jgi:glycosyltransferase involved in cell wall biosynthesis|nr:glycosyltransferase family 2 protein [Planctomycetaceae bacterium]
MLKLSVCCSTYNRPEMLGELIASFEMQDYPAKYRELIVLDDAGQYGDIRGKNWQVVSFPRRFASLGEKRNACVSLTSPDSDHIVIADDDDIYLPHWLQCHALNFENGVIWSFAHSVYWSKNNVITGKWNYQNDTFLMHPAHAFSKKLFWNYGGYPHLAGWEDHDFFKRLLEAGLEHRNSLQDKQKPYMIYRRFSGGEHITCVSVEKYRQRQAVLPKAKLEVGWRYDYQADIENFEKTAETVNSQ